MYNLSNIIQVCIQPTTSRRVFCQLTNYMFRFDNLLPLTTSYLDIFHYIHLWIKTEDSFYRVLRALKDDGVEKYLPLSYRDRIATYDKISEEGRTSLAAGDLKQAYVHFQKSREHAIVIGPESAEMGMYHNNIAVV